MEETNYDTKINKVDSIVKGTIDEFIFRASLGKRKYGKDLDRTDLIDVEYLQHLKEELMDGILYLNKFIKLHNEGHKL